MSPEQFRRVETIFDAACRLPAGERAAFAARQANDDAEVVAAVVALLEADRHAVDGADPLARQLAAVRDAAGAVPALDQRFLQGVEGFQRGAASAGDETAKAAADPDLAPGACVGPFVVLHEIGHGGMGAVYLAEQREPVQRRVALKVIKLGMDTKGVLARFEIERQALAMMDHSHIAKVFEAGATTTGRPYFAMEYVRGVPITRYCDENKSSLDERLLLFKQVCSGVQHAHTKGVIHRDLTPNNVLVTVQEGKPWVKIIDFGLARANDQRLTAKTIVTEQGAFLGTPEYMSPEQVGVGALDVDMRSDVYTLGVLLYELLTGSPPFESLRTGSYDAMCRTIREQDPPRPSTRVSTQKGGSGDAAKLRRTDAGTLLQRLRGDLDWVVLKCLEKDRTRRYETVAELAADIQRHLDHEPVLARAPSFGYRLTKLSQRYRGQLIAAATVLAALVCGLGLATYFWIDAAAQAEEAKRQEQIAQQQASDAERARAGEAANARAAAEQAAIARRNEAQAAQNARAAEHLLAEVLPYRLLAGIPYLARALKAEEPLYPPWPENLAALRRWVDDVGRLLRTQPEIAATLAALRAQALPATAAEIERERTTHPRYEELQKASARLAALSRAQQIRAGQELTLPLPAAEAQAMSARELNDLAWPLVDPDDKKRVWGEEARALVLARLAWDKAQTASVRERAQLADTLAWAWFANGKDAEAIAMSTQALALAPDREKATYSSYLAALRAKVAERTSDAFAQALAGLRQDVAVLKAEVDAPLEVRFAEESKRFLYDTLLELNRNLTALQHDQLASVQQRLAWAEVVADLTAHHPGATATWAQARAAIAKADDVSASRLYAGQGIELRDQDVVGLVPIGMNPATRLWEFYELRSAWDGTSDPASIPIPRHTRNGDESGHIAVGDATGIVFVLLPGGTFTMGAQRTDRGGKNHDAQAAAEGPPHDVTLAPFFLARHELTQGQWQRLTGQQPSTYCAGSIAGGQRITWANPVESVDWLECERWLSRYGMLLPTEAQWEYGCRAGTTTPWWTGVDRASLRGAVNLADQTAKQAGVNWRDIDDWPDLDDGFAVHAPVDALRANAFGLHHVHGNVWEWCADAFGDYSVPSRAGDGLRQAATATSATRVDRGGCFNSAARDARSAYRFREAPTSRYYGLGVRAARALRLD